MQTLCYVVLAGCLSQPGYVQPGSVQPGSVQPGSVQPGSVQPRGGDRSGAARAVYEQEQYDRNRRSSSRGSSSRGSSSRDADLQWQRRDGGYDTAGNTGVSAASFQEEERPARAERPIAVRWVSWTLTGAQSQAALLVQQSGADAEAEELRGVPISLTDVLSRSNGQSEAVTAYWQLVHRVATLGARRREFQDMLAFGKANALANEAWQAALTRVEAQYLEAKRDLLMAQNRLRLALGDRELPIPSDPFWTGEYDTGLSARKAESIPPDIRVSGQEIELHHEIAQKWATTADLQFRVYGAQQQLDRWMVEFEQWRDARSKALDATLAYNLAISRFAHHVGRGDSRRMAKMMLPRAANIARGNAAGEVPR
jgi:hypothetical protein